MNYDEMKKEVHVALNRAIKDRVGGDISRAIGVPLETIHSFKRTGRGGTQMVYDIATWLTSHGYLAGALPPEPDKPPDEVIVNAMATDLEALAAQLRAPIPKETKARLFAERITFWYKSMEEYLKQVKEGK